MTAVVTAVGGFDAAYPWRSAGSSSKQAGSDYYLQAGEPPGRWAGRGAQALGLSGEISEAEWADYDAVYAQTDPRTGERLGRAPADYSASYQATLDRLLAAEPHATAERVAELEWAAHKQTRQPKPYTDVTVSWSKSLLVFHASLRANAAQARQAEDEKAADFWDQQQRDYAEILQDANRAMLEDEGIPKSACGHLLTDAGRASRLGDQLGEEGLGVRKELAGDAVALDIVGEDLAELGGQP